MAKQFAKKTVTEDPPKIRMPQAAAPKAKCEVRISDEQIRQRAFEIYRRRKGAPGDAASDWAQAERELRAELSQ
jgi:hypothetical protein